MKTQLTSEYEDGRKSGKLNAVKINSVSSKNTDKYCGVSCSVNRNTDTAVSEFEVLVQ